MPDSPQRSWLDMAGGFSNAILRPGLAVPAGLRGPAPGIAERRYAVYRNNVTLSLTGALEANFPAVRRLVGEEFFASMASEFVRAHPPKSRLMAEYGEDFPGFIEAFEPLSDYPFIADVARLERLWLDSYHEEDAPSLSGAELAAVDPQHLFEARFVFHPASRLFASAYAAVSIMAANREPGEASAIDPAAAEYGLVTRPLLQVDVRLVSAAAHLFLSALMTGETLGEAAGQALAADPGFDLPAHLHLMLSAGVFTALRPNS